mgnify:CR=1 FL=1
MNKHQLVKRHLQEFGSITSWEAIDLYGATRLSAIIFNLRKTMDIDTMMIEATDRYGNTCPYAKYIYKEND